MDLILLAGRATDKPLNPSHIKFMLKLLSLAICPGFTGGSVVKIPFAKARNMGLIPGPGRSPGEGNGNTFWYSCLENPMDPGVLQTRGL